MRPRCTARMEGAHLGEWKEGICMRIVVCCIFFVDEDTNDPGRCGRVCEPRSAFPSTDVPRAHQSFLTSKLYTSAGVYTRSEGALTRKGRRVAGYGVFCHASGGAGEPSSCRGAASGVPRESSELGSPLPEPVFFLSLARSCSRRRPRRRRQRPQPPPSSPSSSPGAAPRCCSPPSPTSFAFHSPCLGVRTDSVRQLEEGGVTDRARSPRWTPQLRPPRPLHCSLE